MKLTQNILTYILCCKICPLGKSALGGKAEDDVEAAGFFTSLGSCNGVEVNRHGLLQLGIAQTPENKVPLVAWITLDITLGSELVSSLGLYRNVEVGGSAGIRHRLDGAKIVFAGGTGEEAAVTLKVFVELVAITAPRVEIDTVGVHLP